MKPTSSLRGSLGIVIVVSFVVVVVLLAGILINQNIESQSAESTRIAQISLSQTAAHLPTATPTNTPLPSPTPSIAPTSTFAPTPNVTLTVIATYQPTPDPAFSVARQEINGAAAVFVPSGYFIMGDIYDDSLGFSDEVPHAVYTDAYWIDEFLVTNAEFARCVQCGAPEETEAHLRPNYFGNPVYANYPVIEVSWEQANDFCEWRGGRLPTEAEWEKAAGWNPVTGHTNLYPWGSEPLSDRLANFNNDDRSTTPVNRYPDGRSPVGAYDMAGNVWQWVADWHGAYNLDDHLNPLGAPNGTRRVMRGGSWHSGVDSPADVTHLRVANRGTGDPNNPINETGFRCVYADTALAVTDQVNMPSQTSVPLTETSAPTLVNRGQLFWSQSVTGCVNAVSNDVWSFEIWDRRRYV